MFPIVHHWIDSKLVSSPGTETRHPLQQRKFKLSYLLSAFYGIYPDNFALVASRWIFNCPAKKLIRNINQVSIFLQGDCMKASALVSSLLLTVMLTACGDDNEFAETGDTRSKKAVKADNLFWDFMHGKDYQRFNDVLTHTAGSHGRSNRCIHQRAYWLEQFLGVFRRPSFRHHTKHFDVAVYSRCCKRLYSSEQSCP